MPSEKIVKPELVFAVVGATGTDLEGVCESLKRALTVVAYSSSTVRLSSILHEFPKWSNLPSAPEEERISAYMDAGDEIREQTNGGDAVAILGCGEIREICEQEVWSPT